MDDLFSSWISDGVIYDFISSLKQYDLDRIPGQNDPQRILSVFMKTYGFYVCKHEECNAIEMINVIIENNPNKTNAEITSLFHDFLCQNGFIKTESAVKS